MFPFSSLTKTSKYNTQQLVLFLSMVFKNIFLLPKRLQIIFSSTSNEYLIAFCFFFLLPELTWGTLFL